MTSVTDFQVVVLGGNLAGVGVSHHLLKNALPHISGKNGLGYKLTMITPNSQVFWKIGVPRIITNPDEKWLKDATIPIKPAFEQYGSTFEHVQGLATSINASKKTVEVRTSSGSTKSVSYDALVLTTGSRSKSSLWTMPGTEEETLKAVQEMKSKVEAAQSFLIAGGGPVAVETAGEILSRWPKKEITLVSGADRILKKLRPAISETGMSRLRQMGVELINDNVKVVTTMVGPETTVKLSNGMTKNVDLYIDATGVTPNTAFLPPQWVDGSTGRVPTDEKTLRVTGVHGVYAMGDITSFSLCGWMDCSDPCPALAYSVWEDFKKETSPSLKEQRYTPNRGEMLIVPIGPSGGVGAILGWRVFSWMVRMIKSRNFFYEMFPGLVAGKGVKTEVVA